MEGQENKDRDEIYANVIRAGKRTYFFDVRSTRGNDYYLTITESKRRYNEDGTFHYQKHKIFLYKEDFGKFCDALVDTIKKIAELQQQTETESAESIESKFTDINFEDLGSKPASDENTTSEE
ncbi:MAG: DUF3276 family protein [Bacteroidetes bacterium]|nr:MAG: DUF3276 family protein [Bacteroidota bacterium]